MNPSTSRAQTSRSPGQPQLVVTTALIGLLVGLVVLATALGSVRAYAAADGAVLLAPPRATPSWVRRP